MRVRALSAFVAVVMILGGCASGGAASPIGTAAGDVIGGTAWLGVKGAKLAWKGGKFAAKTTGRTVVGAAKGVHEEFSKPESPPPSTASTPTRPAQVGQASQAQSATFAD